MRICEANAAIDRLQRYMRKFETQGFTEFVFRWFLREGKRGQLMAAQLGHQKELAQFLEAEESQCMAWLQYVSASDFEKVSAGGVLCCGSKHLLFTLLFSLSLQAADNLKELAVSETDHLAKKKVRTRSIKLSFQKIW